MPSGSSLKFMMEKIPKRAFDVAIAEQHAVTFSAGLSTEELFLFVIFILLFFKEHMIK